MRWRPCSKNSDQPSRALPDAAAFGRARFLGFPRLASDQLFDGVSAINGAQHGGAHDQQGLH